MTLGHSVARQTPGSKNINHSFSCQLTFRYNVKGGKQTEADDNDSKMAPSEVPSETETEDSVGKKPRARRLQDADRKALGEHVLSQEDLRTYVVVAYVKRFKEPDESSWGEIAETLSKEIGLNQRTTRSVLHRCQQHHANPAKQKPGAGRPKKLEKNNKGLLAAIVALNGGVTRLLHGGNSHY